MSNSVHDVFIETSGKGSIASETTINLPLDTSNKSPPKSKVFEGEQADHDHKIDVGYECLDLLGETILIGELAPDKKVAKDNIARIQVSARLTTKMFVWETKSLNIADIVAVSHVLHTRRFVLHSFPFQSSRWPCSRKHRRRKDFYFLAPRTDEAAKWVAAFQSLKCFVNYSPQPLPASKRQGAAIDVKESPSNVSTSGHAERAMLVILNPRSGSGRARKIYDSKVEPILKLADIKLTVVETNGPNHAQNLAATADISTCINGIICVGGDGIVNEVLNGVLSRDDIKQSRKIPIGIIPAGSDNSLIWSVMGIRDPISAAISIVKMGHTITYYGFMSDVLELSEKYQKRFGPLRYFVAGALKFLCLSGYECEIEYLPAFGPEPEVNEGKTSVHESNVGDYEQVSDVFSRKMDTEKGLRSLSNRLSNHDSIFMTPTSVEHEHGVDSCSESSEYVRSLDSKLKWSPPMRVHAQGGADDFIGLNHPGLGPMAPSPRPRSRSKSRLEKGWSSRSMEDDTSNSLGMKWNAQQESCSELNFEPDSVGSGLQKPTTHPLFEDDKWVLKKGLFLCVMVCNHQCKTVQCAKSQTLAPNAKFDDKNLDLLLVHNVGRLQLLRFLILMQFGWHLSLPFVESTKVQSVKLRPGNKGPKGCGIDGELVPLNGPITVSLHEEQWHLLGPLDET